MVFDPFRHLKLMFFFFLLLKTIGFMRFYCRLYAVQGLTQMYRYDLVKDIDSFNQGQYNYPIIIIIIIYV